MNDTPLVSIIVPMFNEEGDIPHTLEALKTLTYPRKEIILVDDGSTDNTVHLARQYTANSSFKLLRHPKNRGAAAARNTGIRAAKGEILIILNADTLLPHDFIERVLPHYHNGSDYVLVQSRVCNTEHLFPRFIGAQAESEYAGQEWIQWTEGFSCRKSAAVAVGLFPEEIEGCSGEDVVFANRLAERYRKKIDSQIVVAHIAPWRLKDFWRQQFNRGRNIPRTKRFGMNYPLTPIALKAVSRTAYRVAQCLLLFPTLIEASQISRCSPRKGGDLLPFAYARMMQMLAQSVGEILGLFDVVTLKKGAS